jgi:hypothetical protein
MRQDPNVPDVNAPPTPPEPELILGKFKDQAALEKAYTELEGKLGERVPPTTPPAPSTDGKINFDAVAAEMRDNNGELSKDTYDMLETHGINKDTLTRYFEGQAALAERARADLASVAGGEEGLKNLLAWADENISEREKVAYNQAVDNDDLAAARLLLRGIQAQFSEATPTEPQLLTGMGPRVAAGARPFGSIQEQTKAIQDPRYKHDPAYEAEVIARIAVSDY